MEQASTDAAVRQSTKNHRERVRYYLLQGCTEEVAEYKASIRDQIRLVLGPGQKAPKRKSARSDNLVRRLSGDQKTCRTDNLTAFQAEPEAPATARPQGLSVTQTEKLRRAENLPGRPAAAPAPESLPGGSTLALETGVLPSLPAARKTCLALPALSLVTSALVVGGASFLLIESSAAVFGAGIHAWLKAFLLELGILGLSVWQTESLADFLIAKLGAIALAALSLTILHTGVKNSQDQALAAVEASSEERQHFREERAQISEMLKTLPANQVTRREGLLHQMQQLSERLRGERALAANSAPGQTVERTHVVEALMRAALMFLNMVFAHRLIRQINPNLTRHPVPER